MGKKTCRGEHRGHLCSIAKAGRLKKIVKLSGQPKYICKKCGRVADCAENLCHPKSFDKYFMEQAVKLRPASIE